MYHGVQNSSVYRQFLSDPHRLKSTRLSDVIKQAIKIMEKIKKENKSEKDEE